MGEKERGLTAEESEAEAAKLNSSKSNAYREAAAGGGDGAEASKLQGSLPPGEPDEATNLNLSRSNIERKAAGGGGKGSEEERASNLNLSKSNVEREGGAPMPPPAESTVVKSKSNITNNRGDGAPE